MSGGRVLGGAEQRRRRGSRRRSLCRRVDQDQEAGEGAGTAQGEVCLAVAVEVSRHNRVTPDARRRGRHVAHLRLERAVAVAVTYLHQTCVAISKAERQVLETVAVEVGYGLLVGDVEVGFGDDQG